MSSYPAHQPRQIIRIKHIHLPLDTRTAFILLSGACTKRKKKKNHLARTFVWGAFTCAPFCLLKRNKGRKTKRQRSNRRHELYARRCAEFTVLLVTIFTFLTVCGHAISSSTWLATDCIVCGLPKATVPFGNAAKVAFLKPTHAQKINNYALCA